MNHFRHAETAVVVLAAGQGTRMKSDLAKVLHPMAGRPLLGHVLDSLEELGVGRVLVVVGYQRERVIAAFQDAGVEWVVQAEQNGTGHAVRMALPNLGGFTGTLLVVYGDVPLLRAATLDDLLVAHEKSGAAVTFLSMRVPDPTGYGRILNDEDGGFAGIVEHRDATPEQRQIDEVNSGICVFQYPVLERVLGELRSANDQGELYLTDTVQLIRNSGLKTHVVCAADYRELMGVNTVEQLEEAERLHTSLETRPGSRTRGA